MSTALALATTHELMAFHDETTSLLVDTLRILLHNATSNEAEEIAVEKVFKTEGTIHRILAIIVDDNLLLNLFVKAIAPRMGDSYPITITKQQLRTELAMESGKDAPTILKATINAGWAREYLRLASSHEGISEFLKTFSDERRVALLLRAIDSERDLLRRIYSAADKEKQTELFAGMNRWQRGIVSPTQ